MKQINVSGLLFFREFRFRHLWKHTIFFLVVFTPLTLVVALFELPLVNRYPGQIRLQPDLTLHSSDKTGIVSKIHVFQGTTVDAGETLVTLRSVNTPNQTSLDNALKSINNNIEGVQLSINVLKEQQTTAITMASGRTTKTQEDIERINAELDAMNSEFELLSIRTNRFKILYSKGAASKHELETHEINLHSFERSMTSKRASLNALTANLVIINDELNQQLLEMDARIAKEMSEIKRLEQQRNSLLKSEIWTVDAQRDGTVTAINITESEQITPGQPLIDIVGPDEFPEIDFYQPIQKKTNLSVGSQVKVSIDAYPTEIHGLFDAEISIVGKSPTKDGTSFKHTAKFPEKSLSVLPPVQDGYSVMVSVLVDELTIYEWLLAPYLTPEY